MTVAFDIKPELLKEVTPLMDALITATQDCEQFIKKGSYGLLVRNITTDKVQVNFQFNLKVHDPEQEREIKMHTLRQVSHAIAQLS